MLLAGLADHAAHHAGLFFLQGLQHAMAMLAGLTTVPCASRCAGGGGGVRAGVCHGPFRCTCTEIRTLSTSADRLQSPSPLTARLLYMHTSDLIGGNASKVSESL